METKSRYEVISNLEEQKRSLIRERDELQNKAKEKERIVTNLERNKEDITKQKQDFEMKRYNQMQDLEREKSDFDFKIDNTEDVVNREIIDAIEDLKYFKETINKSRETVEELIEGVNQSLERFGKLQK